MAEPNRLLVFEPASALADFLREQMPDWDIVALDGLAAEAMEAKAALITETEAAPGIAANLREQGMIGPIFALTDHPAACGDPLVCLVRPLRLGQLTGRLAEPNGSAIDGAIIGDWRVQSASRSLARRDGEMVERLTDKEFELLSLLLLAAPKAVTRETLQTDIWRYHADASTHTVETHIWRLRQKLETDPAAPRFLLTDNDGYKLKPGA